MSIVFRRSLQRTIFLLAVGFPWLLGAQQPIQCGPPTENGCTITRFDRVRNQFLDGRGKGSEAARTPENVGAVRASKVLYSGSILSAPTGGKCSDMEWRVVLLSEESSNVLLYGPTDIAEFCPSEERIVVVVPVTVIWAQLFHYDGRKLDPFRKTLAKVPDSSESNYCPNTSYPSGQPRITGDIRPCDRYTWLGALYTPPAGTIYNRLTQPGTTQGAFSFTPAIGRVPSGSLACQQNGSAPGCLKTPAQSLNFDAQVYPSGIWGPGYIGFPIFFEKATAATANLSSLSFALSYDMPFAKYRPELVSKGNRFQALSGNS